MNKDQLKNLVQKKGEGNNDIAAQLYQMYFFERFIERIVNSRYKNNIILKGGLLLAAIIGDSNRTTKDMDANIKDLSLTFDTVKTIVSDIIKINMNDHVTFEILSIDYIRDSFEYSSFRVKLLATLETIRYNLAIEVSTGDIITPREMEYEYKSIFEEKTFPILSYTVETIIAEKFHCIMTRGVFNTRMKDFYDIHKLLNRDNTVSNLVLKEAIKNTFYARECLLDYKDIANVLVDLKESSRMKSLWIMFQKKAPYASEIAYLDLFESLYFINSILKVNTKQI